MKKKSMTGVQVKDAEQGTVEAVFSRFNVIDLDGDVTFPGAFEEDAAVRISAYNHASWGTALPVGKGTIKTTDEVAVLDGQFFMDTEVGKETFTVVKNMEDLQEWSYGYDILERMPQEDLPEEFSNAFQGLVKLKVHEVSPVILGAGIDTGTLSAKGGKMKLSDHITLVLTSVDEVTDRAADVVTMRAQEGKSLGSESSDLLVMLESKLKRLGEVLKTEPGEQKQEQESNDDNDAAIMREVARFERSRAGL